jgi:tetratricopeptide (TPR) repeat protein
VKNHRQVLLFIALFASQPQAADDAQAKTYFNAGAQAYEAGQFSTASRAFEMAYKLSPKPGVLFSLGQSERRQYFIDRDISHLERALDAFRRYVDGNEQGSRRREAVEALSEIEPLLQQSKRGATASAAPVNNTTTKLMVTSATTGAQITLDDGVPSPVPFIQDVSVGMHHLRVSAEGFVEERRDVPVEQGALVALDFSLQDEPAHIEVHGPVGASVWLDGLQQGTLPLTGSLLTARGSHRVGLLKPGLESALQSLTLERGELKILELNPPMSAQRVAAWTTFGVGAASIVAAVTMGIIGSVQAQKAQVILDRARDQNISPKDVETYNEASSLQANLNAGFIGFLTLGIVVDLAALGLFTLDSPRFP